MSELNQQRGSGMCYEIGAEVVLANVFRQHGIDKVAISTLKDLREKIENGFPALYVDITKYSISSAISFYPDLFMWKGGSIARVESSENLLGDDDYVLDCFNRQIPDSFRDGFIELIKHSA